MKVLQVVTAIAGTALVGLGVSMALTNPAQDTYEEYAVEQLTTYLKDEGCKQAPKAFGGDFLQRQCKSLVDTGRPQIEKIISQTTQRQNFIFFSFTQAAFPQVLFQAFNISASLRRTKTKLANGPFLRRCLYPHYSFRLIYFIISRRPPGVFFFFFFFFFFIFCFVFFIFFFFLFFFIFFFCFFFLKKKNFINTFIYFSQAEKQEYMGSKINSKHN
jgi:hypothetical protein